MNQEEEDDICFSGRARFNMATICTFSKWFSKWMKPWTGTQKGRDNPLCWQVDQPMGLTVLLVVLQQHSQDNMLSRDIRSKLLQAALERGECGRIIRNSCSSGMTVACVGTSDNSHEMFMSSKPCVPITVSLPRTPRQEKDTCTDKGKA